MSSRTRRFTPTIAAAIAALAALAALGGAGCGEVEPPDTRPNVILVLSDDQRYDTLGITGGLVETPNLDRLAREGALFTRAYVTTSLCCPARASLFTSLYAHKTGIRNNEDETDFLADHRDLAEVLGEAGYETAFFGKWHIHNPESLPQPGFDHWVSFDGQGKYHDETFTIGSERRRIEGFNTDALLDLALEWIRGREGKPFFAVISLKNVHRDYEPPERHLDAVVGPIALPASYSDPAESLPKFTQRVRTTLRNSFFDDGTTHEENVRGYHRMVMSVDDNVGRLFACLEDRGILDRTALVFTSDGGFMLGEHGLYRKRTAYEPSIHVPLLVRYPTAVPAGRDRNELVLNIDIAPTLLDWAGITPPAAWQGRSLAGLSSGTDADWREDFLYIDGWGKYVDGPQELAVCGERFKYVRFRRGEIEEALFDLEADPDERTNLASDGNSADRLETQRGRMRALLSELEAPASWMEPVEPGNARDD